MNIGIYGYGNLGKAAADAVKRRNNAVLTGVFTRRDPRSIDGAEDLPLFPAAQAPEFASGIDVMINCGGSASDLPESTPFLSRYFNVVDSFDTHAAIPSHYAAVDDAARSAGHTALISAGWDPGLFSLFRAYAAALFPDAARETFWGPGVSQGHTQALKRIPGVTDAVQFTMPDRKKQTDFMKGDKSAGAENNHRRVCFVCAPEEEQPRILQEITQMPHYFKDYRTQVFFVSAQALNEKKRFSHGGSAYCVSSQKNARHLAQLRLSMESNPVFTASVLVGFAFAVHRLAKEGSFGAKTVFELPAGYLFPSDGKDELFRLL